MAGLTKAQRDYQNMPIYMKPFQAADDVVRLGINGLTMGQLPKFGAYVGSKLGGPSYEEALAQSQAADAAAMERAGGAGNAATLLGNLVPFGAALKAVGGVKKLYQAGKAAAVPIAKYLGVPGALVGGAAAIDLATSGGEGDTAPAPVPAAKPKVTQDKAAVAAAAQVPKITLADILAAGGGGMSRTEIENAQRYRPTPGKPMSGRDLAAYEYLANTKADVQAIENDPRATAQERLDARTRLQGVYKDILGVDPYAPGPASSDVN